MIRMFAERLMRGSAFRRWLPRQFGSRPIHLSGDSALSYLKPRWAAASRPLLNAAAKFAAGADSVWDIGANCGVFTLAAAHVASPKAHVLAVEPDPFLAALLQKTAREAINSDLNISVLCAAASDRECLARLRIATRGRSSNSLEQTGHHTQAGGTRFIQHALTTTLDRLLEYFPPPEFVKIDVEGAEHLVLQGAGETLTRIRPTFYIEVWNCHSADIARLFQTHDYQLFDGDSPRRDPISTCSFNTLAMPIEKCPSHA